MKPRNLLFLFCCVQLGLSAQIVEDFSDGDLTQNPAWSGDLASFTTTAQGELQLNAPEAGTARLFLPLPPADTFRWELYFRLEFPPSDANRLRIYLWADSSELLAGNGFFLEIGENGSADAFNFFLQEAGQPFLLARGTDGSLAAAPAQARLRLTHTPPDAWLLEADFQGGGSFQTEFQFEGEAPPPPPGFFGLVCFFTTTRKDRFFFDDLFLGKPQPDTLPPTLLAVEPLDEHRLRLRFDEPLDSLEARRPEHYELQPQVGQPDSVSLSDPRSPLLHFAQPFQNFQQYTLTVRDLPDAAGNRLGTQSLGFTYLKLEVPEPYEVLINEIMADPSPPVALPDVEYVELFNAGSRALDVGTLRFAAGGEPVPLPGGALLPGAYLLLCDAADTAALSPFGAVLGLQNFPTLNNSGDELSLSDSSGRVIHTVRYSPDWYGDADKAEGGWSLELINPLQPCRGAGNWHASSALIGGTPGRPNALLAPEPDTRGPEPLAVFLPEGNPQTLQLILNEAADPAAARLPESYRIAPSVPIGSLEFDPRDPETVRLLLAQPLETGQGYTLTLTPTLKDCLGNPSAGEEEAAFGVPEPALPGDVVINEILFDPRPGGADFVELFNAGSKILDPSRWLLARISPEDTTLLPLHTRRLFFPGQFFTFSPEPLDILSRYAVPNPQWLFRQDLPPLPDDGGNLSLLTVENNEARLLDALDFSPDMHDPLLLDAEGVSLERLHPARPTQDPANWHSAAATAGYATPTAPNSQRLEETTAPAFLSLPYQTFSPDGDGYRDFLPIAYNLDRPGWRITLRIYDPAGRLVKELFRGELLGTHGTLKWAGETAAGSRAPVGPYVLWAELFHPDGELRSWRKGCVLALPLKAP